MTNDNDSNGLTRRRAIAALGVIGAGSAATGAGTFALFSDTKSSSAGLSAGSISLVMGSNQSLSFTTADIKPTDNGSSYVDLRNDTSSTLTGNLSISVPSVTSVEGDNPSAETETTSPGELADQVELRIWIGTGGGSDTTFDSSTDIGLNSDGTTTTSNKGGYEVATNYAGTTWTDVLTGFSGPVTFNVEWQFPDLGSTNNDAQGDEMTVDFDFTLAQQ